MPNLKTAGLVSALASLVFFSGPAAQAGSTINYKMPPATKQGTVKSGPITPTPNKNNTEKIEKIHIPNPNAAASSDLQGIMAHDKAVNDAKAKERELLNQVNQDASGGAKKGQKRCPKGDVC